MPNLTLKLTDELAADIRARVKSLDFGAIEKISKAKDQHGTFDVIISTEDTDRSGEIVKQSGWELTNYKNNPIVLWGHDYYSLPVGVCTETYITEVRGLPALGAKGVFLSAEINPFAQQVRKLYEFGIGKGAGVGCTTSVGFIPKEFDENARNTITKAELLEFSFVPIPANQGVGPAQGRAFTFDEAKELGLDIAEMRTKGMEFVEKAECKGVDVCEDGECEHHKGKKKPQAGDACTMDDGSTGALGTDPKDPDGALVCIPQEEKSTDAGRATQKALLQSLNEEHDRHIGEVDKAFDEFRECAAASPEEMREGLKDLRASVADEHTMHRAKGIAHVRGFNPAENKAFDKNEHLKSLRGEHDGYEAQSTKALNDLEERCIKGEGAVDEHIDRAIEAIEGQQRAHKKAVTKLAKTMCKDAFGEEEQADEETLALLKEFLAPHIDAQLLPAVAAKLGAKLSAQTKVKIAEAHQHLKAAKAVLEALHGGLADGSEEESRSDDTDKTVPAMAPAKPRSKPRQSSHSDEALKAHLQAREIVGGIEAAARAALGTINTEIRSRSKK